MHSYHCSPTFLMDDSQDAVASGKRHWELLSGLLKDDRFVNQLEILFIEKIPSISGNTLKNLSRIHKLLRTHLLGKRQKPSPLASDPHLKPLEAIREGDIRIPHIHLYNHWAADWSSLYGIPEHSLKKVDLTAIYEYTRAVEANCWANRVRWRFLMLAYYLLSYVASTDGFSATAQSKVSEWRKNGAHYNTLCQSLGGYGPLFLLPDCLSEPMRVIFRFSDHKADGEPDGLNDYRLRAISLNMQWVC